MRGSIRSELARIEDRDGFLRPRTLVEEARDEASPLHSAFEWNDEVAGERFRLAQAGALIRRYKVVIETAPDTMHRVRAFVSVPDDEGAPAYMSTESALADDERRNVVLEQARRDIQALRNKYRGLVDFDELLRSMVQEAAAA